MTIINQNINNTKIALPQNTNRENISFKGFSLNSIPESIAKPLEFVEGTINRPTFTTLAIVFLLGCRYMQARNKDEKREVATRDFSAVVTAVYGVPILKKIIGEAIGKHSGFAILDGEKQPGFKIFDRFLAEGHQIKEWYSFDKNQNLDIFAENLSARGAKLNKVFGKDEEAKKALVVLSGNKGIPTDNNEIIEVIKKADKNSDAYKTLEKIFKKETMVDVLDSEEFVARLKDVKGKTKKVLEQFFGDDFLTKTENIKAVLKGDPNKLSDLFNKGITADKFEKGKSIIEQGLIKENKALQHAQFLKGIPLAASILSTAAFLGWLLPWFNIHYTRAVYKSGENNPSGASKVSNSSQSSMGLANNFTSNQRNLFNEFIK
jgi:hypothetical protein